ncbi:MAG: ABC transporter ATP-binding protein/permease [Oscillospiraceae bacterium]|nr:ABC transporter ATP-binding protein/permease [Oscillospiraceae bacterium]
MSDLSFIMRGVHKYSRRVIPLGVLGAVMDALVPFAGIFLPMIVLSLLTYNAPVAQIILYVGGFTLFLVLLNFFRDFNNRARGWHMENVFNGTRMELKEKNLDCDYSYLEDPKSQDLHALIWQDLSDGGGNFYITATSAVNRLITGVLGFTLFSLVLSGLNIWIILLLTTTAVANYFVSRQANRYEHKNKENWSPIEKKIEYMTMVTENYEYGKDIRLYNMKPWFISVAEGLFKDRSDWDNKVQGRRFRSNATNALTVLIRDGAAYAFLIYMVVQGSVGIADFILYFGAIAGFSNFVTAISDGISEIGVALPYARDMRKYLVGGVQKEPENPLPATWLDSKIPPKIEFKNVCFSYTSEQKVIDDLSLTIDSKEKVALVGINGAGKTTIVKLLCGFISPTSGEILIDGESISNYRKKDLFALFSAVFQDEFILPLTIAENIAPNGVGDAHQGVPCTGQAESIAPQNKTEEPSPCLITAALKKAGLWDYVSELPDGVNTHMTKMVSEDGVILSGGQNQKLFLARALHKDSPILILDEPTAALDPIAESEVYEQYNKFSSGKSSIFISHRLASTRFCDKVVLLEGGKILEEGTHDELIALGGEYANMYDVQSHYYRDGESLLST